MVHSPATVGFGALGDRTYLCPDYTQGTPSDTRCYMLEPLCFRCKERFEIM